MSEIPDFQGPEEVDDHRTQLTRDVMNLNAEMMDWIIDEVNRIEKWQSAFIALTDEIMATLAKGGVIMNRLNGDILMDKLGITEILQDEDDDDDE